MLLCVVSISHVFFVISVVFCGSCPRARLSVCHTWLCMVSFTGLPVYIPVISNRWGLRVSTRSLGHPRSGGILQLSLTSKTRCLSFFFYHRLAPPKKGLTIPAWSCHPSLPPSIFDTRFILPPGIGAGSAGVFHNYHGTVTTWTSRQHRLVFTINRPWGLWRSNKLSFGVNFGPITPAWGSETTCCQAGKTPRLHLPPVNVLELDLHVHEIKSKLHKVP